ncbi:MAG: RnfABCDGE type electron transport complex subunit G [Lachnospiraceae bacterium]|nr:RnfABCDGE type electron transport complex subunit G [Lachnospiraceae bacterium]
MKNMIKDALILFAITLIAGLALGAVHFITEEPIRIAEEKALNDSYREVFGNASTFEEVPGFADPQSADKTQWTAKGFDKVNINKALIAKDASGNTLGYVFDVTSHEGYGGDIEFTMGVTADGVLNGISLLSIKETAGLGMRAEEVLKPQFASKPVQEFEVTKTGSTSDSQIDAISGATITSKAITKAVNAGLDYYSTLTGGAGNEN